MKKISLTIIAIAVTLLNVYSQSEITECNGNWNTNSTWENGLYPIQNDTIIIDHYVVLNTFFELNNKLMLLIE